MKLERFAYFLAVAQTGSITLGAQKSFITQTAMSQQMAALEAELGLPLLKRSKSGTSLTEAGQALVPMAERLVQCYQAIETFADADDCLHRADGAAAASAGDSGIPGASSGG